MLLRHLRQKGSNHRCGSQAPKKNGLERSLATLGLRKRESPDSLEHQSITNGSRTEQPPKRGPAVVERLEKEVEQPRTNQPPEHQSSLNNQANEFEDRSTAWWDSRKSTRTLEPPRSTRSTPKKQQQGNPKSFDVSENEGPQRS